MFTVVVPLCIPASNIQEFHLLYSHWYCQSLLDFGHPSRYVVVIRVALISLISDDVEHMFMCLLSFPIPFIVHSVLCLLVLYLSTTSDNSLLVLSLLS